MSQEAVFQRLEALVRTYRGSDFPVTLDMPIANQFMDSVELMDFVLTLEDEFHLDITDDEADRFVTLADVVAYIENH